MKAFFVVILISLLGFASFAGPVRGDDDAPVSLQTFHDQLAGQGTWLQDKNYGAIWQPTESDPNWQPYTDGYWINTSEGMTWVSNESFGWATYHYGRWADLHGYGWVWVPGDTWSPAWVSWRYGDPGIRGKSDIVGWAPLPPESEVGIDYPDNNSKDGYSGWDFHIGDDADHAYGIGPRSYHFCPVTYMGEHDCSRYFYNQDENADLIGHTRNVTDITFHQNEAGKFGQVTTGGSLVAALNVNARVPLERVQLASVSHPDNAGLHGETLAVYAPRSAPAAMKAAPPDFVGQMLAQARGEGGGSRQSPSEQTALSSRTTSMAGKPSSYSSGEMAGHYLYHDGGHDGATPFHSSVPVSDRGQPVLHAVGPESHSEAGSESFHPGAPEGHFPGRASTGEGHASGGGEGEGHASGGGGHSGGSGVR